MRIQVPERMMRYISGRPWMLDAAKADQIIAYLEFRAAGGERTAAEIEAVTKGKRLDTASTGAGVAVIPLFGVIAQRADSFDESSGFASLERFMAQFREAVNDESVGTVVIHCDSPGGSVDGIAEATDEIFAARERKRLVCVSDPLCASAAYSLGSACHEVVVTPSGMLGSIGVIAVHAEYSKAERAMGIGVTVVTAGEFKGEGNQHEPLSADAEAHLQESVDDYYALFVNAVARNRGTTPDAVMQGYGQGRALTAKRAVQEKLADRVATLDQVLTELGVKRQVRAGASAEAPAAGTPMAAAHVLVPIRDGAALATAMAATVSLSARVAVPQLQADARSDDEPTDDPAVLPSPPEDDDEEDEDEDPMDPQCQETPTDADRDAPTAPEPTPESEPQTGKENQMAENANGPQNAGAGESATKRATAIAQLCAEHNVAPGKVAEYIGSNLSVDAVGNDILKSKRPAAATSPRPSEEAPAAPAKIRRRFSSKEDEPGFAMGMAVLAMGAAVNARKNNRQLDPAQFLQDGGFPEIAAAMRSDRFDQGGSWVPEHYMAGEFIELLRPASAIRKLAPRGLSLEGGTATLPGLAGGATSYYKAEGSPGTVTGGTTKRVTLLAKELMTFVPMTTQLVRRADPDAAAMIRDDAVAASAQRFDLAAIRGDGTESSPKGLKNLMASANQIPANATVNLANVTDDLGSLRLALLEANVKMIRPGIIFAPRTEIYLRNLRDGNGNYAFRDEMNMGKLDGFPFASTTQIPTNLGGGSDESEIYLADFADVVVGEEPTMQIDVFDQITYYDGSAWQSSGQNNELVLRVVEHHDVVLRHAESAAMLTAVKWGA